MKHLVLFGSVWIVLALAAQNDIMVHQTDVTTENWKRQPDGFASKGQECSLK